MPRQYTTPHMTNKHREALFRDGTCPYCNTASVTSETKVVKLRNGKWYDKAKYRCQVCGAMGTFRHKVVESSKGEREDNRKGTTTGGR